MEMTWNGNIVAVSVLLAIVTSYTVIEHIQRMRFHTGRAREIWVLAGGISFALAIWVLHCVSILGLNLAIPLAFDFRLSCLSLVPMLAASLFMFYQLARKEINLYRKGGSAIAFGAGIAMMNYIGLESLQTTPDVNFTPFVFIAPFVFAIGAIVAIPFLINIAAHLKWHPLLKNSLLSIVMGLALATLQYVELAGANFDLGTVSSVTSGHINPELLTIFLTLDALFFLGGGILASVFDQQMEKQGQQNLATFQQAHITAMNMAAELQQVLNSVSQGVVVTDTRQHVTYVNGAFETITGYAEADIQGRSLELLSGPETNLDSLTEMHDALDQVRLFHADILNYKKNGELFWNEFTINPVRDARGNLVQFVGVLRDVTERKSIEQSIKEFKSTLDHTFDCVFMFDAQSLKFFYVNRGALDHIGYTVAEMMTKHPYDIKPEISEAQFHRMIVPLLSGEQGVLNFEAVHQHKNGKRIPVEINLQLVAVSGERSRFVAVVRDITERKRGEKELEQHRDHLQELVEARTLELHNSEAEAHRALSAFRQQKYVLDQHAIVVITDIKGRINYANDKFCAISGYDREELLGQDHSMLNSGFHPHGYFREMYRAVARGKVWHGEICNRAKDGEFYWVDTTIAPFLGEDGKPEEYISIRTDITERKRAEDAAHSANSAKSEFLANMSHEIRTPMNGVLGMLDILLESQLTHEQRRRVETTRNSALALLSILNDILDFSKIEAGKLSLESIPIVLRDVVEGVVQLIPSIVTTTNIDFHVFVSPDSPACVLSDPVRLHQILFNLLGNALKFSSKVKGQCAQVVLRVEPAILRDSRIGLRLTISDNGIGMSKETMMQLFKNFSQADEGTTRVFGGTGLGLSITKRLVEMMSGEILVSSTLGVGSEFTVELPLKESTSNVALMEVRDLSGVNVLMVSDDPYYSEFVPSYIRSAGAKVRVVGDMREIVIQSGEIVLLDPNNTATESICEEARVVQLYRGSSNLLHSKVVSVSACPILYGDLLQAIAIACGKLSARDFANRGDVRQMTHKNVPTVEAAAAAGQLVLLAEDNETNSEVIKEQLRLLGYASEVAVDGLDALNKWRTGIYALLLTDCHMPNMDGFQLTKAIRDEQPEGGHFTIIAVSANAMQGEASRCLLSGMDDYLSKPLRLSALNAMLNKWLPIPMGSVDAETLLDAPCSELINSYDPLSLVVWDSTMLYRMVGDDVVMHQRLLTRFLAVAGQQIEAITTSVEHDDCEAVVLEAHKLKSAALTVGAQLLGELCRKLEIAGKLADSREIQILSVDLTCVFKEVSEQIKDACVPMR